LNVSAFRWVDVQIGRVEVGKCASFRYLSQILRTKQVLSASDDALIVALHQSPDAAAKVHGVTGCAMDEFACHVCGCPAVVYPKVFQDDEPVTCAGCASFVATYGELKKRAERAIGSDPDGARITGC